MRLEYKEKDNEFQLFIKIKENSEKRYIISDKVFNSILTKEGIVISSYFLDESSLEDLRRDGVLVMTMIEELEEISNIKIIISILQYYIRNNTLLDTIREIKTTDLIR